MIKLFSFLNEKKSLLIFIVVINIAIKLPLIFLLSEYGDTFFYRNTGQFLLLGYVPFKDFDLNSSDRFIYILSNHPNGPFNYFFYSGIILLIGESDFSIKLPIFISEILACVCIYKIGILIKNKKFGFYSSLIYGMCPISFFPMMVFITDEIISSLFVLLSIYFLFSDKIFPSAIFLSVAFSYKYYSVFLLIPVYIYLIKNKGFKEFVKYLILFLITFIIISLPYLIICPFEFLNYNLYQVSRFTTVSFGVHLSESFLYVPLIQIDLLEIKVINFIQVGVIIVSFYYFLKKSENFSKLDFMAVCAFYTCILPIISLSNNFRYFIWFTPFLSFLIVNQKESSTEKRLSNVALFIYIIFLVTFSYILIYFNFIDVYQYSPFYLTDYDNFFSIFLFLNICWLVSFLIYFHNNFLNLSIVLSFNLNGISTLLFYIMVDAQSPETILKIIQGTLVLFLSISIILVYIFINFNKKYDLPSLNITKQSIDIKQNK